jgi:hypothetical protein
MGTVNAQVIDHGRAPESSVYPAPHCWVEGRVRARFGRPEGFRQWILTGRLERGTTMEWGPEHGDEALYLIEGELGVGDGVCHEGGAVIVESGMRPVVTARSDSRVVHVGADPFTPDDPRPHGLPTGPGQGVHLVEPVGLDAVGSDVADPSILSFFANGRCPSCRLMLYRVSGEGNTSSHLHTQPQLQHVLWGEFKVGSFTLRQGSTFAVPAGYRYAYRASGPWQLLVHRPDLSMMRYDPRGPLLEEGEAYTGTPPRAAVASAPPGDGEDGSDGGWAG